MAPSDRKVVLITGCSAGGIGHALCIAFAPHCHVFASARRLSSLTTLPSSIDRIELDVTSPEACQAAIDTIIMKTGRIDILINNAGAGASGPCLDFKVEDAKKCFEANLFAPMRMTQLAVPHMAKRKSGLIINIGSIVGNIPTPWAGVYSSSKAALHAWTEVLRMEVKGLGVNVLLVAPGAITSGFGQKQIDSYSLPADSLYKSVASDIEARAKMSQRPDHTIPAAQLASGIVKAALRPNPPVYYTAGGKSFLFWILERLPRWFVWRLLSKILGAEKVGK